MTRLLDNPNGVVPRPHDAYVAADHISRREWLIFGAILLGGLLSISAFIGVIVAVAVTVIRALKG